jgi:hypothetical protein
MTILRVQVANKVLVIDRWWETTEDYIGVGEQESYEEEKKG